ncbi:hypothetical protein AB5J62_06495 [Amycolatopsis sp. cg5]
MSTPTDIKEITEPQVIDDLLGAEPDPKPDPKPEPDPDKKTDCADFGCGH